MINLRNSDEFIQFQNTEEKIAKLKEWTILNNSSIALKPLIYRGIYTDSSVECDVIGYISKFTNIKCIDDIYETAVIKIGDKLHKINSMHLKDMQESAIKINDLDFKYEIIKVDATDHLEVSFMNNSDFNITGVTISLTLSQSKTNITLSSCEETSKKNLSSKFSTTIPDGESADGIIVNQYEINYESNNVKCNTIYNPKSKRYTIY